MANVNETAFRVSEWFETGTATNAAATATRAATPAPVATAGSGRRHIITGILITMSAAPTAGGSITMSGAKSVAAGGPTANVLHTIAVGAAPSPLFLPVRIECDAGTAVSVALPALGAAIVGTVTIFGFTTSA